MPNIPEKLSRREREILNVLYALRDGASAGAIRAGLTDPPTDSAVRAMLARLEAKGQIRHRVDGPRYIYFPTTSRGTARRLALQQIVNVFFDGSPGATAKALLTDHDWSDDELESLSAQVERVRNERRS